MGNFVKQEPQLERETLVAVNDGDPAEQLDVLDALVTEARKSGSSDWRKPLDSVVEFHLDIPGLPSYSPLGYGGNTPQLNIDGARKQPPFKHP